MGPEDSLVRETTHTRLIIPRLSLGDTRPEILGMDRRTLPRVDETLPVTPRTHCRYRRQVGGVSLRSRVGGPLS